ncbi:polyprenyl synthetase family protein [Streptomyces alfalfae]|uniref:Geranylgeranyl pyrophosphate synthase n=1 Tax=Streptomyces alfalfae TaxID=1642299 RepID=A0ABM6H1X7_9ACTN|nr:geranylgeranyl pyrophosphate synthase [Streptomyces alfalfae]AYA20261.1 polyprenyl synthetase family protein [Streptomyces fradiae]QUI30137.1 polyprenyl synthetase family protein [Streptomyces alfalfae]RXX43751.1 polyprenyl synthetase family protein [Streptomyces alfalfae]RZN05796.1 polyprenyl synthetase family protein [Streptomyces alfalfae]
MCRTRTQAAPAGGDGEMDLRHGHARTPALVDADVPAAVGHTLDQILRERLDAARDIDATFADDVARRVARFTLDGGKRMRSQFLWWSLRACGGPADAARTEAALRLAAGLELIQTCALVHDDVMDGSPLRRGGASVHRDLSAQYARPDGAERAFGRSAAILVGDLALAWADDVVAATALSPPAERRVRELWRAMRTEMVAGQYLDLHGQATDARSVSRAIRTASLKSALYSVERPLALGAAVAEADEAATGALCSAGRCAGLAFQLRDDLLGAFGDPRRTGKPSGEDLREGKLTYLVEVARARAVAAADHRALALLESAVGNREASDDELDRVRDVLVATGARTAVQDKIQRLAERGLRCLDGAALTAHAAPRLRGLLGAAAGVPLAEAAAPPGPEHSTAGTGPDPVRPSSGAGRR